MFLAAALAKPISNKIGKAELSVISSLVAVVVCIVLFIMRPENVWVYVAMITICYLGLGMFNMVVWALITDVIVYALYSFARKIGQAASAGLSGLLLTAVGYTEATAFDEGVVNGIFNISTLIPALGFGLLAVVLWFWYPLHKKQVDANIETLKKKHGK